jgi:hypothetical protein
MASLMEEAKEAQKNIENVEKIIDDPGLCKKIYNSVYQENSTAVEIEENDGKGFVGLKQYHMNGAWLLTVLNRI